MAKAFKYGLKGITGYLEPAERDLLRSLIHDVISMLQPEDRDGQDPLAALIDLDKDEIVLTPDGARHWSMALNDVRLVLAERLDIQDEEDAEHVHLMQDWSQAEDVESYLALVYNFATWLQESLVQAMLQSLDSRR